MGSPEEIPREAFLVAAAEEYDIEATMRGDRPPPDDRPCPAAIAKCVEVVHDAGVAAAQVPPLIRPLDGLRGNGARGRNSIVDLPRMI